MASSYSLELKKSYKSGFKYSLFSIVHSLAYYSIDTFLDKDQCQWWLRLYKLRFDNQYQPASYFPDFRFESWKKIPKGESKLLFFCTINIK